MGGKSLLLGADLFEAGARQVPLWCSRDPWLKRRHLPDSPWTELLMQLFSLTLPALHSMFSTAGKLAKSRGQKVRRITDAPVRFPTGIATVTANSRPEIICSNYTVSGNSFQICPGMFFIRLGNF